MMGDAKGLRESYCWTDERTKLLIDIGLECTHKGQKLNTNFTKEGWTWILEEYNKKCGKKVNMLQLKNKWMVLKQIWNAWMYLKNKTSWWGWNMDIRIVDPPTKEHWDDYVKKHPQGKHFKNAPLQYEEELQELFQGFVADGEGTICTSEIEPRPITPKVISASNI
ncbi:L10-interacting MYB domain-containing protein-like [Telopea speciosissima]|uniref:L10-interacting MYB domain-containing protein-like n=1 Tax=Telopea speciosissima TaxID=54955 RepID=UPI001CC516A8|nr:L10-interacting MYB domain-containing protein-like [Telopea speciosissima]